MKNWLFADLMLGVEFIVEAETKDEAGAIANELFPEPDEPVEITDEEADALGYDTYQKGENIMRKVEYVVRDEATGTAFKIVKTNLVKCEDSDERDE